MKAVSMQQSEIIDEVIRPEGSILPSWRASDKLAYRIAPREGQAVVPRMFVHLQLKMRKREGDAIMPTSLDDICAVINLPGMLLWSAEISFNDKVISKASTAQTYATYLRALSEFRPAQRSGLLNDAAIWLPDNPVRPDEFQLQVNENHLHRAVPLAYDGILEMHAPLMSDILLQPDLIPDNVAITIILVRNAHAFLLNVQPKDTIVYELGIVRADLCIKRQHTVHVHRPIRKASVKLSYSACDTRMFFFERNTTQLAARVLQEGVLPSRFIAMQIRKDAFDGKYQRNALDIQFNDTSKASLFLSGIPRPLQCYDFGGQDRFQPSKRAYFEVMSALDTGLTEPIVSFLEFTSSSCILAWDLRFLRSTRGSLELRIDLNAPLQHDVVVIGCYFYERGLTCHSNGDISFD